MPQDPGQWLEDIWTVREEQVYPRLFGPLEKGMYPLMAADFARYGKPHPDPRFLLHGVLLSPPNPQRKTWLYVSSGMSNAWGATPETADPNEYSGLGYELLLETPEKSAWAVSLLHWLMVVQLLVAAGDLQGQLLEWHDWVPIGAPVDGQNSPLTSIILGEPDNFPKTFDLASGKVDLLVAVGITQREREFAKAQGGENLIHLLHHHAIWPLTNPTRPSIL